MFGQATEKNIERALIAVELMESQPNKPVVALTKALQTLAGCYIQTERLVEAEQICWRLVSMTVREFGDNHELVRSSLQKLASVLEMQGRDEEAHRYYEWARQISPLSDLWHGAAA